MTKAMRIGGIITIAIIALATFGGLRFMSNRSLPAYSAELTVDGLQEEVKIVRDDYGIPHIYAKSMTDAFFAQGYCQAQDRLWEMDLSRRAVSGHLSEILGESMLQADKFFLTLGIYKAARDSYKEYDEETKSYLESYAAGVNQYINEVGNNLPPEFKLLSYKPQKWDPLDTVSIGKYMAHILGGNMTVELLYLNMAEKVSEDKLKELLPTAYPDNGLLIMKEAWRDGTAGKLLAAMDMNHLSSILALPGEGVGSNNWVIGGKMTQSGKPILCNDPHLEIKSPSIWYQNHLVVEGKMNVTGVIAPGTLGVIVGHNDRIAWGVTNVNPDVQDLYLEKRNPQNQYQFEYKGKWEDARVIKYEIPIKKSKPIPFEVVYSRHGPIINGIYPEVGDQDLALKWTAHMPTCEIGAVIGFNMSNNWNEFKNALEEFKVPAQNFVYADVDGNIAYRANGLIPIRKKGNGLMPVPGWTDEYEWEGFIPWDTLPQTTNPPEGFIITANNKIIDDAYPYFITHQWSAPYRALSIRQELEGKNDITLNEALRPQNDWKNLQAQCLYPSIEGVLTNANLNETEQKARDILLQWAKNSPEDNHNEAAPTIYHTLYLEIASATYQDELGYDIFKSLLKGRASKIINNNFDMALIKKDSLWFDDVTTPEIETADVIILQSFKNTVASLQKELGNNPDNWKWGKLHTITIDHPMGTKAFLKPFLNDGPYPQGGSNITSGANSYAYDKPFAVTSAGPWRFGVDLGDMTGKDILAGGTSGHFRSDHYKDQTALWLKGQYKDMLFNSDHILENNEHITVLKPSKSMI